MKTKRLQRWWQASCKRLLWGLIPLLALSGNLQAQECVAMSTTSEDTPKTPIPMIVKGNKWIELRQHFTDIEEEGKMRQYYVSYAKSYEVSEEVEINGKKYHGYSSRPSELYFREANDKVYMFDKTSEKEWMIFDYDLKIGDVFAPYDGNDKPYEKFRLDQIETIPIAGKERRVFYFSLVEPNTANVQGALRYEPGWGGWHPAYIELAYPEIMSAWLGDSHRNFIWIEGIGVLKESFVFHRPVGVTGSMPDQLLCFTDSAGVEHDIAGIGCDIDKRTLVSAERPEGNLAASISLFDGHLRVKTTDELPHTVALFALDGTPLLQETSFTGTFETQLTHHESAQPMLLLFDGKASIRLYNSPK